MNLLIKMGVANKSGCGQDRTTFHKKLATPLIHMYI